MNDNIVSIDDDRVPVAKGTLYQWHSKKKYPTLVFKLEGRLYFDLAKWSDMLEEARLVSKMGGRILNANG